MHSLRALWTKISGDGWRRTALVNTIAVTLFTLFVVILLAWSTSQSRGGLDSNLIFFDGDCARSATLNLWLHLLLNACSTGVIASSNFFMQVLSSPSRSEVDKAHRKESKLAIGVPSLSNLFHVARFKCVCWLLFFASSFPIHLFFNSAIFATKYKGAGFHLSIAADAFIDGAQYSGPGAVLWHSGAPDAEPATSPEGTGYGTVVNVTQYFDQGDEVAKNIEFAARSSRRWKRLDVPECLSQYMYCNSHDKMRDVVWVVKSHNSSGNFMNPSNSSLGWRSTDVLDEMDLVNAAFWNDLGPRNANNSLWFAANCSTSVFFKKDTQTIEGCYQTCSSATGNSAAKLDSRPAESIPSNYTFNFLDGYTERELPQMYWPGLIDQSAATLDLKYCLSEEISTTCKVGLSNKILLAVLVCLLVKAALCVAVLFTMPDKDPLVVPGDAVASFIRSADKFTAGWCTLDRKRESKRSVAITCAAGKTTPVQWHAAPSRRWASAIPPLVWLRSYGLFVTDIIFVGIMFGVAQKSSPLGSR